MLCPPSFVAHNHGCLHHALEMLIEHAQLFDENSLMGHGFIGTVSLGVPHPIHASHAGGDKVKVPPGVSLPPHYNHALSTLKPSIMSTISTASSTWRGVLLPKHTRSCPAADPPPGSTPATATQRMPHLRLAHQRHALMPVVSFCRLRGPCARVWRGGSSAGAA